MSAFAASIAAEVKSRGIDVVAVHPSPVASNFYDKTHKLGAIEFFKQYAPAAPSLPAIRPSPPPSNVRGRASGHFHTRSLWSAISCLGRHSEMQTYGDARGVWHKPPARRQSQVSSKN